jgi:hypothetical protein
MRRYEKGYPGVNFGGKVQGWKITNYKQCGGFRTDFRTSGEKHPEYTKKKSVTPTDHSTKKERKYRNIRDQ